MGLKAQRYIENNIQDVKVDLYVIGKFPQGECIVCVILINEMPRYSVLIDSCDMSAHTIKKLIFNRYTGLKKVNLLVWTHPHEDHSEKWRELALTFGDKHTLVLAPANLGAMREMYKSAVKEAYEHIVQLNVNGKRREGELNIATDYKPIQNIEFVSPKEKISIQVETYAPNSRRIGRLDNKKEEKLNVYSLFLCIKINHITILLTGDTENLTIRDIVENCGNFENVIFLKIPHHSSFSSNEMRKLIDFEIDKPICVTTSYENGDIILPQKEVIQQYKEVGCPVFAIRRQGETGDFGMVHIRFDLLKDIEKYEYDWLGSVEKI